MYTPSVYIFYKFIRRNVIRAKRRDATRRKNRQTHGARLGKSRPPPRREGRVRLQPKSVLVPIRPGTRNITPRNLNHNDARGKTRRTERPPKQPGRDGRPGRETLRETRPVACISIVGASCHFGGERATPCICMNKQDPRSCLSTRGRVKLARLAYR